MTKKRVRPKVPLNLINSADELTDVINTKMLERGVKRRVHRTDILEFHADILHNIAIQLHGFELPRTNNNREFRISARMKTKKVKKK